MKYINEANEILKLIEKVFQCPSECSECALNTIKTNRGTSICNTLYDIKHAIENKLKRSLNEFQKEGIAYELRQTTATKISTYAFAQNPYYNVYQEWANRAVDGGIPEPGEIRPLEPQQPIPRPNRQGEVAQEVRQAQRQNAYDAILEHFRNRPNNNG